jgi:hypothetical protein
VACGGGNVIGPDNQLEVTNAPDDFQFQVSNLTDVSQTLTYTWTNTGTQATVDISQAITAGSVILTIRDQDGAFMYTDDLREDNDGDTAAGRSGIWEIEIRIEAASGTFNFRVQRKT